MGNIPKQRREGGEASSSWPKEQRRRFDSLGIHSSSSEEKDDDSDSDDEKEVAEEEVEVISVHSDIANDTAGGRPSIASAATLDSSSSPSQFTASFPQRSSTAEGTLSDRNPRNNNSYDDDAIKPQVKRLRGMETASDSLAMIMKDDDEELAGEQISEFVLTKAKITRKHKKSKKRSKEKGNEERSVKKRKVDKENDKSKVRDNAKKTKATSENEKLETSSNHGNAMSKTKESQLQTTNGALNKVKSNSDKQLGADTCNSKEAPAVVSYPSVSGDHKYQSGADLQKKAERSKSESTVSGSDGGTSGKHKKTKMNFQDQVFNHMLLAYKPFTLKTLADALKTTEAALNFVMLSLVDKGLVTKKDFASSKSGRTKTLYWAVHGVKAKEVAVAVASPDEIQAAQAKLASLRSQHAALQSALADVMSEPSNAELDGMLSNAEAEVTATRKEVDQTKSRIQSAQNQTARSGTKAGTASQLGRNENCPRRLKMRINHMRQEWKNRKEKCNDLVEQMADGMEKKPKEIYKMLDLETDEMAGVTLPPLKKLDGP